MKPDIKKCKPGTFHLSPKLIKQIPHVKKAKKIIDKKRASVKNKKEYSFKMFGLKLSLSF